MQPILHAGVHCLSHVQVKVMQSTIHVVMFDASGDGLLLAREILRKENGAQQLVAHAASRCRAII